MPVKEAGLDLPLPAGEMKSRMYIWDRKTGNLASKVLSEIPRPVWKLTPDQFTLIGKVTVRVEHEGEPVKLAFVKLKDAAGERESTINESRKGEATFFGVKPGTVSVTVNYMSKGQDAEPVKLSRDLVLKRDEADPEMVVSLTGEVETTGAASKGEGEKPGSKGEGSGEKPKEQGGNIIGSIIVYLLGLGAAAAAVFFLMRYMKQNQDKVSDQLKKLGVEIPDPNDPAQADPGPAPVPVPPAPPQKIILDDADPGVPPSSASVAPVVQSVSVSSPSLVMENGDVFPLPEGETTVGREVSNALSLVAESTVSRAHAVLIRNGSDVAVRDLGSSNGTFVNGVKVAGDMNLRPGDQVQFGQARFRYEA